MHLSRCVSQFTETLHYEFDRMNDLLSTAKALDAVAAELTKREEKLTSYA